MGDMESFKRVGKLPYKEQAVWFLNAFWAKGPTFGANKSEGEVVWTFLNDCIELDPKGDKGNELDEVLAHRVLEKQGKTLTVRDMREVSSFKKKGANNNRRNVLCFVVLPF